MANPDPLEKMDHRVNLERLVLLVQRGRQGLLDQKDQLENLETRVTLEKPDQLDQQERRGPMVSSEVMAALVNQERTEPLAIMEFLEPTDMTDCLVLTA